MMHGRKHSNKRCVTLTSTFAFIPSLPPVQHRHAFPAASGRACRPAPRRNGKRVKLPAPRACGTPPANSSPDSPPGPPPASSDAAPCDLPVLALPMTAGNDVLFPGCNQTLKIDHATAQRVLNDVLESETSEFAYVTLNAWNEPGTVGTIATVDDFQYVPNGQSILRCSGVARFRLLEINETKSTARFKIFNDERPSEEQLQKSEQLEERLVSAIQDMVTLTLKISDDVNQTRQKALEETLGRVKALSAGGTDSDVHHWILDLSPDLRRELLSFIFIDKLDVSFMDRRAILESTDTADRLDASLQGLEPLLNELAAKGAIIGALGRDNSSDESSPPASPSSS